MTDIGSTRQQHDTFLVAEEGEEKCRQGNIKEITKRSEEPRFSIKVVLVQIQTLVTAHTLD